MAGGRLDPLGTLQSYILWVVNSVPSAVLLRRQSPPGGAVVIPRGRMSKVSRLRLDLAVLSELPLELASLPVAVSPRGWPRPCPTVSGVCHGHAVPACVSASAPASPGWQQGRWRYGARAAESTRANRRADRLLASPLPGQQPTRAGAESIAVVLYAGRRHIQSGQRPPHGNTVGQRHAFRPCPSPLWRRPGLYFFSIVGTCLEPVRSLPPHREHPRSYEHREFNTGNLLQK